MSSHDLPRPIILDTDLGDDIDDTWAIALLLKSPELDVKLITTTYKDTATRAAMLAKLLEIAGRTDIPIGIGQPSGDHGIGPQGLWSADYDLTRYPGTVHQDGVAALVRTIMASPVPVTVISIGPMGNIAAALRQQPAIAQRAHFIGMQGSVKLGYHGASEIAQEWNVVADVPAAQASFTADWDMTITPVDTCGLVQLTGEKYQAILASEDPLIQAMIAGYQIWARVNDGVDPREKSSILFDTVAIYLAISHDLLEMAPLGIRVTDDGYTVIEDQAKVVDCALAWKDLPTFEDFLVNRLTTG
jgi:inosine-uridine nucleoside N-ribohydrolase